MNSRPSSETSPLAAVLAGPTGFAAEARRVTSALIGRQGSGSKSCKNFASQAEAQAYFEAHGGNPRNNVDNLDRNHNGIACEVYPYGRAGSPIPGWLQAGLRHVLVPGAFAAVGWAAGRQHPSR